MSPSLSAQAGRTAERGRGRTRSRVKLAVKALVTLGLLALLLDRVNLDDSVRALRRAQPVWIVLGTLVCSTGFLASSQKWHGLLAAMGVAIDRWAALRIYAIGHFASSFFPGTIGGDLLRCNMVRPVTGGYVRAFASVLAERASGVVTMVALAIAAVAWRPDRLATPPVLTLVGIGSAGVVLALLLALNRRLAVAVTYRLRRGSLRRVVRRLYELHRILRSLSASALAVALGWSVGFYFGSGLLMYTCCRAFERPIGVLDAVSVVVVVSILMLIPISLGGLGLRQVGDVMMLDLFGVDPGSALVISLLRQAINYFYTLIGGVFFVLWTGAELGPHVSPREEGL
ncbi:MAG TPA: lysylphosphatidylglycerol synthase transmembrane domain-containing protein [Candidatus Polarisedimenticolaceae bacterium]|nr:lysylphosphatidylglycerol synthase transmembrane domain-containing protein [Candidatus Polarisedimenticolaceae bacterium]